jgi:hypothetical protein
MSANSAIHGRLCKVLVAASALPGGRCGVLLAMTAFLAGTAGGACDVHRPGGLRRALVAQATVALATNIAHSVTRVNKKNEINCKKTA